MLRIYSRVIVGLNGAILTLAGAAVFLVLLGIGPLMNQKYPDIDAVVYGLYGLLLCFCGIYQLSVSIRRFNYRSLAIGYFLCLAGFLMAPWAAWVEIGVFVTGLILLMNREGIDVEEHSQST